jgi:hypothetical protein
MVSGGLLDAGFEEVGGLQEDGGAETGEEAGGEVEGWRLYVSPWCSRKNGGEMLYTSFV